MPSGALSIARLLLRDFFRTGPVALVPEAYAREMMASIPRARLAVIPRAGHVPMWENPAGFNRELLAFLASVD